MGNARAVNEVKYKHMTLNQYVILHFQKKVTNLWSKSR